MKSCKWPPTRRADAAFELIDVVAARLDWLILYRVSLLHSGWFTRLPAGTEHLGQLHRMPQRLNLTALLVDEYDTAIDFFVGKFGFELRDDTALTDGKRWVVVAPHGAASGLLLARAIGDRQRRAVGDQSGGRVFLFLETDDFARDHLAYTDDPPIQWTPLLSP